MRFVDNLFTNKTIILLDIGNNIALATEFGSSIAIFFLRHEGYINRQATELTFFLKLSFSIPWKTASETFTM